MCGSGLFPPPKVLCWYFGVLNCIKLHEMSNDFLMLGQQSWRRRKQIEAAVSVCVTVVHPVPPIGVDARRCPESNRKLPLVSRPRTGTNQRGSDACKSVL